MTTRCQGKESFNTVRKGCYYR